MDRRPGGWGRPGAAPTRFAEGGPCAGPVLVALRRPRRNRFRRWPLRSTSGRKGPRRRQDRGYGDTSELALTVEAVEALRTSSPTVTLPARCSAPIRVRCPAGTQKEHHACHHSSLRGVDTARTTEVTAKVKRDPRPGAQRAPRLRRLLPHRGRQRRAELAQLFETPEQTDASTRSSRKWITDENFASAIPNPPKITIGKVVAHSNGAPALAPVL